MAIAISVIAPVAIAAPADIPLVGANSGKATTLRRGQSARVELQTNASTGYMWKVDAERGINVMLVTTVATRPGMVGAPSVASYRVMGARRGTYRIVFRYMRPWEGKAVRTLTYIVRIV
ncbi:protease inhibitor I42 family protein [Sphingomonas mali]|uniref:protease inhibitor I42 family protein n=1 Tax=Sphingomonas mali TaxID=40682 RepID=UPI000833C277|nr:protease inhibitor I42 family protein [Sphingomonas mali]